MKFIREKESMKAVNSVANPIHGVAKNVNTDEWNGRLDFTVTPMDDFSLVLGMDFLHTSKAVAMPHLSSLLAAGPQPCLLKTSPTAQLKKQQSKVDPFYRQCN